jgi:translation elongation factor EF-G
MINSTCEGCGLSRREWKDQEGGGVVLEDARYCCEACAQGLGCVCKETGTRRQVVVDQEENKQIYVKKMDRQIKEWQTKVKELETRSRERHAEVNARVKRELELLRQRIEETRDRLKKLAARTEENWAEESRGVSGSYKNLKASVESAGSRIKRK